MRVWFCFVRRAIDIVSLAFPPHPSGYERDEVRAYRNRLLIDFSLNGLIQNALTRLLEWRLDRGFNCFEGDFVLFAGFVVLSPALSALPPCGPLTRLKIYDPLPKKIPLKERAVCLVAGAGFEPFVVQSILNRLLFLLPLQVMSVMR